MDRSVALWRRSAAEGIAAFALVFAGCGAIIADARYAGALGAVGVALVFGLVIMAMVYATEHLSGAHINPRSPSRSRSPVTSRPARRLPISARR